MAKSPKPRKSAPSASFLVGAAMKTTTLRVVGATAVFGLGLVLLILNERRDAVANHETRPAVTTVAAKSTPAPALARAVAVEESAPAPARREEAETFKEMPPSVRAAFDSWLMGTYAKCWRAPKRLPDGDPYAAKVRVSFHQDGTLASQPRLVNPPSDPAWKAHAEAAIKAVKGCDPLHVPDKYAEYYPSWKSRTVYFDPTRN